MEFKKQDYGIFENEVINFLNKIYVKYSNDIDINTIGRDGVEKYIFNKVYDDFLDEYSCHLSQHIKQYVSNMLDFKQDNYMVGKDIASLIYYGVKEKIKNNTIIFIDHDFWSTKRIIRRLNKLYNLGMNTNNILDLILYNPGLYQINNYAIRLSKDNKTIKIRFLKAR